MSLDDLPGRRLCAQGISCQIHKDPQEAVSRLAAVQAQDRPSALYAIGLRAPTASWEGVEEAVASGGIVRTWLLRGTLHFVDAEDVRWMLDLVGPRVMSRAGSREAQLHLDEAVFARSGEVLVGAMSGGPLPRGEAMAALEREGIATTGGRGYHILWHLALSGLICFGPMHGRDPTFVLLDDWVPRSKDPRNPVEEMTRRYFTGHGPAKVEDLAWWSGLPVTILRDAVDDLGGQLTKEVIDGETYWSSDPRPKGGRGTHVLPAFDEYIIGYRDRSATLDRGHTKEVLSSNGMFYPTLVIDGQVRGTWKAVRRRRETIVQVRPFSPLNEPEVRALELAAERYGEFLGRTTAVSVVAP